MPPAKKKAAPVKKAAAKRAQDITGPSSEPTQPVVTLGPVSAPVVRTSAQVINADVIIRAIEAWNIWTFTPEQRSVTTVLLTAAGAFVWNLIEKRQGRRLVGAAV